MATKQSRERDGTYTFDRMERLCKCGHKLGVHFAASPRACGVGQTAEEDVGGKECDEAGVCQCKKFRATNKG